MNTRIDSACDDRRLADVDRPYTLLSCAMSIDGYLDDATSRRLRLSGDDDIDRIDAVRAGCDAILVGAGTIRADDPRLVLRSPARREARIARAAPADPVKVALSGRGDLDPAARFFTEGRSARLVYVATGNLAAATERLGGAASIVDGGEPVGLTAVLADLAARGIGKLMVEGGGSVLTQFLVEGLADELQLVVAPFFVGDSRAPRFAGDGSFPWTKQHPARLAEMRRVGRDALLRFALSDRFRAT